MAHLHPISGQGPANLYCRSAQRQSINSRQRDLKITLPQQPFDRVLVIGP